MAERQPVLFAGNQKGAQANTEEGFAYPGLNLAFRSHSYFTD